mgnify:CR=1 FL=1
MSILIDRNTPVIVQGITGKMARFHTADMVKYGTNVVAVSYTHLTLPTNREV